MGSDLLIIMKTMKKVFAVIFIVGTLVVLTLSKNTGAYVHDPAGDKALPYKHDASGDKALPYKHDPSGDTGLPYNMMPEEIKPYHINMILQVIKLCPTRKIQMVGKFPVCQENENEMDIPLIYFLTDDGRIDQLQFSFIIFFCKCYKKYLLN